MLSSTARTHVLHQLKRVNHKTHFTRKYNFASGKSFTKIVKNVEENQLKENSSSIHQSKVLNQAFPTSVTNAAAMSSRPRGEGNFRFKIIIEFLERVKPNLKVGDVLHNYQVTEVLCFLYTNSKYKITPIPERNLTAYRLTHLPTGADHLHIDCADTNNAFWYHKKNFPIPHMISAFHSKQFPAIPPALLTFSNTQLYVALKNTPFAIPFLT